MNHHQIYRHTSVQILIPFMFDKLPLAFKPLGDQGIVITATVCKPCLYVAYGGVLHMNSLSLIWCKLFPVSNDLLYLKAFSFFNHFSSPQTGFSMSAICHENLKYHCHVHFSALHTFCLGHRSHFSAEMSQQMCPKILIVSSKKWFFHVSAPVRHFLKALEVKSWTFMIPNSFYFVIYHLNFPTNGFELNTQAWNEAI